MERRISFSFWVIGVLVFTSVVKAQDPSGTPGVDYPNYFTIPETSFKCSEQKYNPGFYADLETKCQAFHFCYQDRQESFLCPTGTIFNQAVLTCDIWYKSNCSLSPMFFSVNAGPIMERAGKNLPMLLRLRNRSQKKPSIQTAAASVFDKVSQYETDKETPDASKVKDLMAKTNEKYIENHPRDFGNKDEQIILSGEFESEKDNSEETGEDEFSSERDGFDEKIDTNLVYDNVEDAYNRNYDQYEGEWQNSEPVSEEFGNFYNYRDSDNEYETVEESDMNDYINNESFEDSDFSVVDSGYPEFTKRSFQRVSSSVRRKPMYVVLDDEQEVHTGTADKQELDTLIKSETESNRMNLTEPVEETPSLQSFPHPTAVSNSLLNRSSGAPMTSEEFESAIWRDLELTDIPDDSKNPVQSDQGISFQSEDQSDDDTIYIENDLEPDSYMPHVSQYEDLEVPEPGDEAYSESHSESQTDFSDTDDTFVVIPDEYDNVVYSESNEDFEMQNYPEETDYRTQILTDRSPIEGYGTYENPYEYSSIVGYPQHYQQANYNPEMTTGMNQNEMPNDQRYGYDTGYEEPQLPMNYGSSGFETESIYTRTGYEEPPLPMNYESSGFETESIYTQTELYPYEESEFEISESPLQLPVTDADLDNLSNEDFMYVLEDQPEVETWKNTETADNIESGSLLNRGTSERKKMNLTSESLEEATSNPENISSTTPMTSEKFESAMWSDPILPGFSDNYEGPVNDLDNKDASAQSEGTESQFDTQKDDESIYIENDIEVVDSKQSLIGSHGQEPGQPEDVYYVFDFDEEKSGKGNEIKISENEDWQFKEYPEEKLHNIDEQNYENVDEQNYENVDEQNYENVDEQNYESKLLNSSNEEYNLNSNVSHDNESEKHESIKPDDNVWSPDLLKTSTDELLKSPDEKTTNNNQMNTLSSSNLGYSKPVQLVPETSSSLNIPFSSNMGNFDFSTDSRFLNNMGYSESMDFGPYGFGPNMGQFSMMESMEQNKFNNRFSERLGQTEQPRLSSLSAIQEKVRSMKQGKFGAFKKYMRTRN